MRAFHYPALFRRGRDGRYLVTFPDFPRAATDGASPEEAMSEAIDCLGSCVAFAIVDREPVPPPSTPKRSHRLVPVPLHLAPKLALYTAMQELGVTNSGLARRLGVRETVVRRMLDPRHDSRPEKIQAALDRLGRRVIVSVEAA